ncbi:FecR family protein [Gaoshiqia sediminis]|uniref:DUF4974 domain-containing protein n=1 Tax=Gaoshiqia sediminis TaxID=2986998 RepID=A0AA41Y749_9BACT|nr:FecR domain-containing protein [Gaoshiqia sediminis]MCW0483090.1 DUF4974 domain-containing protein [Gaoshiqia sediminis]
MDTNKEKIKRFISGKFSFNDYLAVSDWFRQEEKQDELRMSMEEEWSETTSTGPDQQRLSRVLDKLHHRINLEKPVSATALQRYYRLFSKVAAILLIPALITIALLAYLSTDRLGSVDAWAEIHSPIGTRTKFQLPDGTVGWLNSGSVIKYPVSFLSSRHVEVSGEAWFDVVHRESDPFYVKTPWFQVKVLGTQFNVISYEDEKTAEVILERGKVQVTGVDTKFKNTLEPDQHLVYDKSARQTFQTRIDAKSYTSWKDGLMIFKNEPMAEIARRLERRYHAEIILHSDSLKTSVFRATFQDEDLDEICRMLSTVAPIRYKIHEREKRPDDTFTKTRIEMWLNN